MANNEVFERRCVFDSSPVGTIGAFKMVSGRYVIAKLIESDRPTTIFEDTDQQDQRWEIIDEIDVVIKRADRFATDVRMKSAKEFTIDEYELITRRKGIEQRPINVEELLLEAYQRTDPGATQSENCIFHT